MSFIELFACNIPNLFGCISIENALITKVTLELEMAPMIHWVADSLRKSFSELKELVLVACVLACDILFAHAVTSHKTPFVMVTVEPELSDVFKS